jgi:hypothetical protein
MESNYHVLSYFLLKPPKKHDQELQTMCGKARNNAHAQKNYKQHTCWTRKLQTPHIWTRKLQTPHKELQKTCKDLQTRILINKFTLAQNPQ